MKKSAQVVMLPTNEKAKIGDIVMSKFDDIHILTKNDGKEYAKTVTPQHLYILSDEEIKDGDWCYGMDGIFQYKGKINLPDIELPKKIIATNKSLFTETKSIGYTEDRARVFYGKEYLPQPSQLFIEKFVEEYNKGNVITEVMVEYENIDMDFDPTEQNGIKWQTNLKINSDNTINISMPKDSWSREEVIELMRKYSKECTGWSWFETDEKWIEENL